jgi:ATP-dependent Clp protease ATP-binding subunit ClpA
MPAPDHSSDDIFLPGGRLRIDLFNEPAADALRQSLRLARETCWDSVRSPHIFMGLLAVPDRSVQLWGEQLHADLPELLSQFQELFHQEDGEDEAILALNREFLSDNVIHLLRDARFRSRSHSRDEITPMDLLITLLTASNSIVAECFRKIGVTAARLTELAVLAENNRPHPGSD